MRKDTSSKVRTLDIGYARIHSQGFSMKTDQRGMKFSMKRTCGRREALNVCDCDATSLYSSSYRRARVSRTSHESSINWP
ncbi:hypothetical protein Y032_0026g1402 [Ancylostoma ceylanicum]|uniref:Uncharacterized protein n=1 Tax=Ancylostoma ceylanicum TaxID=53326 RepID=A0A016UTS8_9BILA|nr:hypothetical protein Y032_0026g1402 [Ancylostoma ceylanicum]